MKTLINQYGDLCRHTDEDAAEVVRLNYGWKYCPKHLWKGKMKDEKTERLQAQKASRQAEGQVRLS
jgi:hypothetical protein